MSRLTLKDNVFANSGSVLVAYSSDKETSIADAANSLVTAANPVPASKEVSTNAAADSWFSTAAYKGAFDASNWAADWIYYYQD